MNREEMTNNTELQGEMQNTKAAENDREDKKAFKKMILFTVICGIVGFFSGMFAAGTEDGFAQFAEVLKSGVCVVAPFGNLFFGTITWIACAGWMRQSRRVYAAWDGEDEDVIEQAELKLSYGICLTSVNMIIGFFFFGLGIYTLDFTQLRQQAALINLAIIFVGFFYSLIINTILQKNLVNFTKEINPEKQGSVYDLRFQKIWMESCDESEKLQTYQAGFAAMQTGSYTCIGLLIVCIIGMMSWDFGIIPMIMVVAIWLVLVIRYNAECIRLSKRS
ncbi:MAG: DUF3169 family protein [Roseburia sp.]|nr:DUF3169 family protein [Roseburia sp.]